MDDYWGRCIYHVGASTVIHPKYRIRFDYIDQFGFDLFGKSLGVQEHVVALSVTAGE